MSKRLRAVSALLILLIAFEGRPACASDDVDALARDVDRLESVRHVKDLQRTYAHYAQFGLWDEMARLFTDDADFINGPDKVRGPREIADWLTRRQVRCMPN